MPTLANYGTGIAGSGVMLDTKWLALPIKRRANSIIVRSMKAYIGYSIAA